MNMSEKLMARTPELYCLVRGAAEGNTVLNAFDNALLNAGIGDTNLIRLSSILPPAAKHVDVKDLALPPGAFVPLAYAYNHASTHGQCISSAVAVGIPEDKNEAGVIMEFNDNCGQDQAEYMARKMVKEAFHNRKRSLEDIKSLAIEHQVYTFGATFAAVVLWYK